MRFGRIVADALRSESVRLVFGLPGGKSIDIYDALIDTPEVRLVQVRHPASAAFMAYAYARLSGEPGVCHATVGPGVHNLLSGIAEAWSACMPIIALCPSVKRAHEGEGLLQEMSSGTAIFDSVTKWSVRANLPERIQWFLRRAFQISSTGKPGPVLLEYPSDFNDLEINVPPYAPANRPIRSRGAQADVERTVDMILKSERPVILAGGGVYASRAFDELKLFAESLSIPVFTSCSGKGSLAEDHSMHAGMVGLYRTRVAKKFWEQTDLVISVGSRFEELESSNWKWLPRSAKLIQIDIDANEIGRNWIPETAIVGDAKLVLQDLRSSAVRRGVTGKASPWVNDLIKAKREYEETIKSQSEANSKPIKTIAVIKQLRNVFPRETILCNEHGLLDNWGYSHFPVLEAGACLAPGGNTPMGLAVVGSIAAKLLLPEHQVVCLTGDGAFQMYSDEVTTSVQYHAPVTWCVLNSFSLGWIKYDQQLAYGNRHIGVDFTAQPDFVKLAEAYGCHGETVERVSEIKQALEAALKANKEGIAAILDFRVDPEAITEGFQEYYEA